MEITELSLRVELEISMIKEFLSVVLLPYNGFYYNLLLLMYFWFLVWRIWSDLYLMEVIEENVGSFPLWYHDGDKVLWRFITRGILQSALQVTAETTISNTLHTIFPWLLHTVGIIFSEWPWYFYFHNFQIFTLEFWMLIWWAFSSPESWVRKLTIF